MHRRFWKVVLLFALLHYGACLLVAGVIFLLSHIPPKALNLDRLILGLFDAESILQAPRNLLLRCWRGEATARWWSPASTVGGSLVWGASLAGLRAWWRGAHGTHETHRKR